jgi:hypothetical protein
MNLPTRVHVIALLAGAALPPLVGSDQDLKYSVIGISTDDDPQAAARWLKQSNATLTHFIDRNLLWERALGASAIPLTVLIDERGRSFRGWPGAKQWDSPESGRFIERAFLSSTTSRSP